MSKLPQSIKEIQDLEISDEETISLVEGRLRNESGLMQTSSSASRQARWKRRAARDPKQTCGKLKIYAQKPNPLIRL